MGRPPTPPEKQRTAQLQVQLTEAEKKELTDGAKALGIPAGEVLRRGGFRYLATELRKRETAPPPEPASEDREVPKRRKHPS